MGMISVDGKEYDFDTLSEAAKAQVMSLQFVDAELVRINAEMVRLNNQAAVMKTSKILYSKELRDALHGPTEVPADLYDNGVIKFY